MRPIALIFSLVALLVATSATAQDAKLIEAAKKEGKLVDYVRGDYRLLGDASYMSLFHKSSHPNAAKAFIDFFLDDESMDLMAKAGEFVNRKGVYPSVPDADKIKFVEMDDLGEKFYAEKRSEFQKLFR